ncbi:MAG: metal ABC transporter permease [Nitrospiraceae bacterium]|nr:MAG: metal ABC transporter permease [Nitrospiraceae bacterium]
MSVWYLKHGTWNLKTMIEIFQFTFMIRAFAAGAMIGIIAPVIGTFLVVRRLSRLADTLAHVSLAGVAIGLLTRTDPVLSAVLISVLTAIGVERLRGSRKIFGESALALFLWSGMAIAVVIISLARGFNVGLFTFLFGSIATVSPGDLYFIAILGSVVLIMVVVFYKELFFVSFDEELAEVIGIRARFFNLALMIMAAVTISLSMRIVGILLIGALMIIPVITAMQFSRSFRQSLLFSVVLSLLAVMLGLILSYYFDLASGGTIVLISIIIFLIAMMMSRKN